MKNRVLSIAIVALSVAALSVAGSSDVSNHPGYFALDNLGIIDAEMSEIDINLSGSLLAMVSGATKNEDPELSDVMAQLKGIRVLVGEVEDGDLETVLHRTDEAAKTLSADGWERIVRVREDDERVHIFVKEDGDMIRGMTIFALDSSDEIVLINIVGDIEPAQMGQMLSGLDSVSGVDLGVDVD